MDNPAYQGNYQRQIKRTRGKNPLNITVKKKKNTQLRKGKFQANRNLIVVSPR
jgi:hypothetical protein